MRTSDCWQTPEWLFDELNAEFHFDIDLCATKENSKCYYYGEDYLKNIYLSKKTDIYMHLTDGFKTAFMNPPYSNPKPFIEKAWEDSKFCKIVCLVKCDPSTRWWATFWEYGKTCNCVVNSAPAFQRDNGERFVPCQLCKGSRRYCGPKPGCEVRFFPKRIKFTPPEGFGGKASGAAFPCALVIMDRR